LSVCRILLLERTHELDRTEPLTKPNAAHGLDIAALGGSISLKTVRHTNGLDAYCNTLLACLVDNGPDMKKT